MGNQETYSEIAADPLPDWVSANLLVETKSVWLAEFGEDLTTDDAVRLVQNMGTLFELLYEEKEHEKEGKDE